MKTTTVLVTGATGAIGPSLVNRLLDKGYTVRTYGLNHPAPKLFNKSVEHFIGDINDPQQLSRALIGTETVFHLAAKLHIENPDPSLTPLYHQINVNGSRLVAEQAAKASVRRLIYFSTVKVYGAQENCPIAETHPTTPQTLYARTKLEGERVVSEVSGLETTILRLAAIYGPRLKGQWHRLVHAIGHGWFLPIGNLQNRRSLTYVEDVAQATVLVSEHAGAIGRTFNLVGYESPSMREIIEAIYHAFGKHIPKISVPGWLALVGASFADYGLHAVGKRSPITQESIQQFLRDEVYLGTALRDLGFEANTTLADSWKEAIKEMNIDHLN